MKSQRNFNVCSGTKGPRSRRVKRTAGPVRSGRRVAAITPRLVRRGTTGPAAPPPRPPQAPQAAQALRSCDVGPECCDSGPRLHLSHPHGCRRNHGVCRVLQTTDCSRPGDIFYCAVSGVSGACAACILPPAPARLPIPHEGVPSCLPQRLPPIRQHRLVSLLCRCGDGVEEESNRWVSRRCPATPKHAQQKWLWLWLWQ